MADTPRFMNVSEVINVDGQLWADLWEDLRPVSGHDDGYCINLNGKMVRIIVETPKDSGTTVPPLVSMSAGYSSYQAEPIVPGLPEYASEQLEFGQGQGPRHGLQRSVSQQPRSWHGYGYQQSYGTLKSIW